LKEYPYWWDSLGTAPAESRTQNPEPHPEPRTKNPEPLEGRRVDVAIVGAGYTGLSAALEVACRGASVMVIEQERAGWGASSRNAGQVLTGLKLDPATLVARFGETRARALFDASIESIEALERLISSQGIDCDYTRTGHVQAASKPSHFQAFQQEQTLLGKVFDHSVRLVKAEEQHSEIGSNAYFGLMVDERSGAINPARFVQGLATAACRAGAAVTERTKVLGLARTGSRWTLTTSAGCVGATDVLLATTAYTDQAAPALQRRLVPIGSYVIATEPLSAPGASTLIPKGRMVFDSKHFLHFFRVTRDRRLLFGGRAEFGRPTPQTTARCAAILRREMAAIFPALTWARIDYAWSGNVDFSRDQLPHAGRLDGAYYVGGYCGHGIAMAISLGAVIGRRMAGDAIEHPLFDDRFPAIPFYRGTPWFLPLVGAYYRLRDWLE